MKIQQQRLTALAATVVNATVPDRNTGAYDNQDNSATKDVMIENAEFFGQDANDKKNVLLFTSTGQAFKVGGEGMNNAGLSADCVNGATVGIQDDAEVLKRRKTLTRLQHEVDFWVPKSMAQANAYAEWNNATAARS